MLRDNESNPIRRPLRRSPSTTKARPGTGPRRAFSFAALLLGVAVAGEVGADDCAEAPETEQAACWMEEGCRRLNDNARRTECLRLAADLRRSLQAESAPADRAEPTEPAPATPTPLAETAPASPPDDAGSPDSPPAPSPAVVAEAPTEIASQVVSEQVVDRTVLDIPNRFTADITALRRLARDRQLVAVDNQLLFEGDVAAESALKLGDQVEIQRVSRAFGERYRIIGPSRRPVMARRISCERLELSKQSRRRCLMVADDHAE